MPASDQGAKAPRYTLVPRTLVFLIQEGQVLLIRGAAHKRLWANRYNGIGGHVERGEDIYSAARRELLEEAGVEANDLLLCGIVTIDTGDSPGVILFIFRGECGDTAPRASNEGSLEWIETDRLGDLPLVEDLPALLPKVLEFQPGAPPFMAQYSYGMDGQLNIVFCQPG